VLLLRENAAVQARIAREGILELLQCARALELHARRLIARAAVVRALQHDRIAPDLGLSDATRVREGADDGPHARALAQLLADLEPFVRDLGAAADNDLVRARREH